MGVWHKFDGINTMAQKGESAPNDTAPGLKSKGGGFKPFTKKDQKDAPMKKGSC